MVLAWHLCWAMGPGHPLCLCLSPVCMDSGHIPHCSVTDLAGVCLTSRIPWGPCSPRTGHGEIVRVGERKCWVLSWSSTKNTYFFLDQCWALLVCKHPKPTGGQHSTCRAFSLLYTWDLFVKNIGAASNGPTTAWQQESHFLPIQLYAVVYPSFMRLGMAGG